MNNQAPNLNMQTADAEKNPWDERISFPRLHKKWIFLALLAMALSALQLGCYQFPPLSWVLLPLLTAYVVFAVRAPGAVALILGGAVLASLLTSSIESAAVFLSVVVGAGSLAWLFTARKFAGPIGTLLAVFLLSWLVTSAWWSAIPVFAFFPAGILLAYATTHGHKRTSAICFGSAGFLIAFLAIAAVLFFRQNGTLTLDAITESIRGTKYYFIDALGNLREELIRVAEEAGAGNADLAETVEQTIELYNLYLSQEMNKAYVDLFVSITPALCIILCNIFAFAAQLLQSMTYRNCGWNQVLTPQSSAFTMSVTASVLYYITFTVSIFGSIFGGFGAFGVVSQNVLLILLPGLCLIGLVALINRIRTMRGGAKIFLILLCLLLLCSGFSAVFFLGLWGANASINEALQKKIAEKGGYHGDNR